MASIDEALAVAEANVPICIIDPDTRVISVPSEYKNYRDGYYNPTVYEHYISDVAISPNNLWNMKYGDEAVFGTKHYRYVFTVKGFSDNGIYVKDGLLPKADLYLCTCVPGGEPYEIYIVGLVKQ